MQLLIYLLCIGFRKVFFTLLFLTKPVNKYLQSTILHNYKYINIIPIYLVIQNIFNITKF